METLFLLFLLLLLSKKPTTKSKQRKSLVNKGQTAKKLQNNSDRLLFLTHFVLQKRGPPGVDQQQIQGKGKVARSGWTASPSARSEWPDKRSASVLAAPRTQEPAPPVAVPRPGSAHGFGLACRAFAPSRPWLKPCSLCSLADSDEAGGRSGYAP
jgi:hypothetical protein